MSTGADPSPRYTIRPATTSGAEALTALLRVSFSAAFSPYTTPTQMEAYLTESLTIERTRASISDPSNTYLLAITGAASTTPAASLLGMIQLSPNPPPPPAIHSNTDGQGGRAIHLARLYLAPEAQGSGIAQGLMDAGEEVARKEGYKSCWLEVLCENARAARFYEKCGFRAVGDEVMNEKGFFRVKEKLMVKAL